MKKEWLSPAEAAEVLGYGFTPRFVRRQVELGRLPAMAFDAAGRRTIRINRADLDAFRDEYIRDARDLPKRHHAHD